MKCSIVAVDRIKLNFGATIITEHPFTVGAMEQLMAEARTMIQTEKRILAAGNEPEDWDAAENKAKYLRPVPKLPDQSTDNAEQKRYERKREDIGDDETILPGLKRRSTKMANLVEAMMLNSVSNPAEGERTESEKARPNGSGDFKYNGQQKEHEVKGTVETSRTCEIL